ncbi:MAG: hypothetical protein LIO91_12630 [Bacteroidales bacterium]|nr:hypothetical protein [Bacteroidales bacterium]
MTDEAKEIITDTIYEIGNLFGTLMIKAIEAEQTRAEAEKDGNTWYESWQRKDKELKQADEEVQRLAAELTAANQEIEKLRAATPSQEGDHDNGESN